MFVREMWYVAAWAHEVGAKPLGRRLLDEPIVIFRSAEGKLHALEDRCAHRAMPLSHGNVIGNTLQCGYHGLRYDGSGKCVRAPSQDHIPQQACVKSYEVVERDSIAWIWMGRRELADPALIPATPWHTDPRWAVAKDCYLTGCNQLMIYDNLLDLTHVGYVHQGTIGGDPELHSTAETTVERSEMTVTVRRWLGNTPPPPTFKSFVDFVGSIDREQVIKFRAPTVQIDAYGIDTGSKLDETSDEGRVQLRGWNGITPETQHTTYYFWSIGHNFQVHDLAVTKELKRQIAQTFLEDKVLLEAQYARFREAPARPLISLRSDAGAAHARRILERLQQEEVLQPGLK